MAQDASSQRRATDADRGIQNVEMYKKEQTAQDRYDKLAKDRQLRTHLLEGKSPKASNDAQYWDSTNDPQYEFNNTTNVNRQSALKRKAEQDMEKIFRDGKETWDGEDMKNLMQLKTRLMTLPDFPYIMVIIAVLKDILDFGDLLIVGIVVTTALSFVLSIILFVWMLSKLQGGWWKKKLIKKLLIKYGITISLEFIPFFKIVPATTIFVLLTHYDEAKVVKLINTALGRLRVK